MSPVSTNQRNLIVIIITLVAFQLLLAGVFGFKPTIKAGYYTPEEDVAEPKRGLSLSEERRRELEALLSPPPILAWSSENSDGSLPEDLLSGEALLSFASRSKDNTQENKPEAGNADREVVAQAVVPPKDKVATPKPNLPKPALPEVEPLPIPEISDDGIILEEGEHIKITPVYLERLPDLKSLDVDQRKKRFAAIMLPLILRANLELNERRALIVAAANDGNIKQLKQWAELYRLKTSSTDVAELRQQLLLRVDQVPPSLALAQAAIESGWGTSRFAIQGNALFGQWAWSTDQGIKPTGARYENAVVRSFANLFDSVRAYMHNLNTHHSYENFRRLRQTDDVSIRALTGTLITYSEEREVYVDKLRAMIDANGFTTYDNAELQPE